MSESAHDDTTSRTAVTSVAVLTLGLPDIAPGSIARVLGLAPHASPRLAAVPEFAGQFDTVNVAAIADAFVALDATDRPVVVVYPANIGPAALACLSLARDALGAARVSPYRTTLPPAAAVVLAHTMQFLALDVDAPAAALIASAPAIARRLQAFGWAPSVSDLDVPGVDIGDHVASLLPGSSFLVEVSPTSRVHRVRKASPAPITLDGPARVLVSGGPSAWVDDVLLPGLGALDVVRAADAEHAAAWWRHSRAVDLVGVPADLSGFARACVQAAPTWQCPWCAEPMCPPVCVTCEYAVGSATG